MGKLRKEKKKRNKQPLGTPEGTQMKQNEPNKTKETHKQMKQSRK